MKPMRICLLCHEYPPARHGGVGSFTQTLARALAARSHCVTTVGCYEIDSDTREEDEGVSVVRLAVTKMPKIGFYVNGRRIRRELGRIASSSPIDVIEGPEFSLAQLPRALPATKIIRMNGGHHFFQYTLGRRPRAWRSWIEKRSFACADRLCAVSHYVAETTRRLLRLGDQPIEILPNPIDTDRFRPMPEIPVIRGRIVFVGAVREKKGARQLVQAMPQIVDAVPHAHLWICGRDCADPRTGRSFVEYLRSLIPSHIVGHVEFQGTVEHSRVPEVIASAEVPVYPSHMEAMPLAWLEGLAMGKSVVASRTGPGPEVLENGVSGLLCDPHDPSSIAEKVITLLQDADLRRRMGEQARQRAVKLFSVRALVQRNEEFYARCIHERGNGRNGRQR